MWKFLISALIASTAAFAQAPAQPNQGQPAQAQPNAAGQAAPQPNPSVNQAPNQAHMNARNTAIQQIEQALQQLRQNNQ